MKKWFLGHVNLMVLCLIISICHAPLVIIISINKTFSIEEQVFFPVLLMTAIAWSVIVSPFIFKSISKAFGITLRDNDKRD